LLRDDAALKNEVANKECSEFQKNEDHLLSTDRDLVLLVRQAETFLVL
jgi:hypothetical protein